MKKSIKETRTIAFGLIFPLYALPWIFKGMLRNEKWAFVLFAFLMGLVGILYPPVGDFHQYTMKASDYSLLSWSLFIETLVGNFDFLLYFIGYILDKVGIPFDFTRFLYNFYGYLLIGNLYRDLRANNPYINNKAVALKSLIVFIGLSLVGYLFRYSFSSQLFIYGAYLVSYKKNLRGWLFVVLAVLNHFSYSIFAVGLFIFEFFKVNIPRTLVIIIGISAAVFSGDVFMEIFKQLPLPVEIINHYSYYLDGYYASEWQEELTWRERLASSINSVIRYIYIFVYVLLYSKAEKSDTRLANMLMMLCFVTLPFTVINGRFMGVMVNSIKLFYFKNFNLREKVYRNTLRFLLALSIASQVMGVWFCRRQLSISREYQLLYMPSFVILCNTYDMSWIQRNVDSDGGLIKVHY